jgi:hypothetical protein
MTIGMSSICFLCRAELGCWSGIGQGRHSKKLTNPTIREIAPKVCLHLKRGWALEKGLGVLSIQADPFGAGAGNVRWLGLGKWMASTTNHAMLVDQPSDTRIVATAPPWNDWNAGNRILRMTDS